VRLFVAVEIPSEVKSEIERIVGPLKKSLGNASWVRAEAVHVTLAFIGEQPEPIVPRIVDELQASVREMQRFEAVVSGAGFFPNDRNPRVAWLGLSPAEGFSEVAAAVRQALNRAEVAFDEKPFKGHLTLARIKERWRREEAERFIARLGTFRSKSFPVEEVILYSSKLSPHGAQHAAVGRVALSA
jgi:RNA 2',3'-cyclic 3'-phosphodiesterase